MTIINLTGPPCAGKSTFAAQYVLEHPWFKFCPIDAYRVEHDSEEEAWQAFFHDIRSSEHAIMETCGLNWQLPPFFKEMRATGRKIFNVYLYADEEELIARLIDRQHKRPLPKKYRERDEVELIRWVLDHPDEDWSGVDIGTNNINPEQTYIRLSRLINYFLLMNYFLLEEKTTGEQPIETVT